jgi:hypothetical protein
MMTQAVATTRFLAIERRSGLCPFSYVGSLLPNQG